ncbi:hypothetical protein GQ54DRAFT_302446 [Martensiomyces pterosporus]|nr:hypothetical protein GQ54DRAFT_302446 [Martensiomyces pterosporus]
MALPTDSPRRWFRSASLILTVLHCILAFSALGASAADINPGDISFDYKLAWVDVQSSTFGVSMKATAQSSFDSSAPWSLLIRYDKTANANITQITSGWGLGIYDYSSWALMPSTTPFDPLYFTVHSSGQMDLENTVVKLAEPTSIILVPSAVPSSRSLGYTLMKDQTYTINANVNLAQIPKKAFGPWLSLANTNAESIPNVSQNTASQQSSGGGASSSAPQSSSPAQTSSGNLSILKTGNAPFPQATPTDSGSAQSSAQPGPTDTTKVPETNKTSPILTTHLPQPKFVKGDANYDLSIDPLGTQLVGPRIGLYLVSSILGVGLVAHIAGTIRRYQFRFQYTRSVERSKAGLSFA